MSLAFLFAAAILSQQGPIRGFVPDTPEATHEPPIVLSAERAWAGADILLPLAQSANTTTAQYALRALGRLEDVKVVPTMLLLADTRDDSVRLSAVTAIAQALHSADALANADLIGRAVITIRRVIGGVPLQASGPALGALARLPFANANDVSAAEDLFADILERTNAGHDYAGTHRAGVEALEILTRRNPKLTTVASKPAILDKLADTARGAHQNDDAPSVRLAALRTLLNVHAVPVSVVSSASEDDDPQVRRVAVQVLAGGAQDVDVDTRFVLVHHAMADPSQMVRLEAVRAYARALAPVRGCGPLVDTLQDQSPAVVIAAIDAMGTACPRDDGITTTLAAEARPAPTVGSWQRETHAYVALVRRDPDRAAIVTQAFVSHPNWQVRMYAARAAGLAKDVARLQRLADDPNDNVREAALAPLRKLTGDQADAALVAAIGRADDQLIRTAAKLLAETPPTPVFAAPILEALLRVTREGKETSRDARMALLDALERHGQPDQSSDLMPLTQDFDPQVAKRAAAIETKWLAKAIDAKPVPVVHTAAREYPNLRTCVAVTMENGQRFRLAMQPDAAPIAVGHFLKTALDDRYYDGLTFHRVEPNFVIQGGSPGANEYTSGQKYFMRDEVAAPNVRGGVGLSTRGLNTGDGQIYVMLVDDPRLDGTYTIFANVFDADMDVVDRILEGDRIESIRKTSCGR